ncbi:MAG: hypothetical protein J6V25_09420 [Oscillospiraceae bacterium]|nr:hypothetical protein [Oscillospiraceae bacterium]
MVINLKDYLYTKNESADLDAQFAAAKKYGKVRLGTSVIFWRAAFKQYVISLDKVQRIRRGISTVIGRLCAGGRNYDMEYLVLVLHDGSELNIHITDDNKKLALELMTALEAAHPEIQYGKE